MKITARCGECNEEQSLEVDGLAYSKFVLREGLVQNLFPDLSASERELIMGARNKFGYYCASCWDKMFPLEDEELRPVGLLISWLRRVTRRQR